MPDHIPTGAVYRKTELVGTSPEGFAEAVRSAMDRAQKTLRNVSWFEVKEERGRLMNGQLEFQVTIEVGFALEDTVAS
jgi:flavin-binding protein dodecin